MLISASKILESAGVASPQLDAALLLSHVLGISREALLVQPDFALTPGQQSQFDALVARRAAREPMAQILGRREFWGLEFAVTKDTLDPRPDSETLIEALLKHQPQRSAKLSMLDLGTGTGCLLLAALSEYPLATGLGIDRSEAALAVAAGNARRLGLENRAKFEKTDWNLGINGVWDVVLGNPPYIPSGEIPRLAPELLYEPRTALDGGDDGLDDYRAISRFLPQIMAGKGIALLEIGAGQAQDVARLMNAGGLMVVETCRDLAGIERCVVIRQ